MKHVKKSVLLWYSPREMYDLVTAVEDYPRFLPWCEKAEVLETHDDGVTAEIGLSFGVTRVVRTGEAQGGLALVFLDRVVHRRLRR